MVNRCTVNRDTVNRCTVNRDTVKRGTVNRYTVNGSMINIDLTLHSQNSVATSSTQEEAVYDLLTKQ